MENLFTPEQVGIIENCLNSANGKIYTSEHQTKQIEKILEILCDIETK